MINWTARAKSEILETVGVGTDKTRETPLSSVLSVPHRAVYGKNEGVSSVSSVGVQAFSEKHVSSEQLLEAAMLACDHHHDGPAAREQMRADCLALPVDLRADLLAHFKQTYPESKT